MKTKIILILAALIAGLSSCTKLNSGDRFTQTVDGMEYEFEVIVSKVAFVRLRPVSAPSAVKGELTLPHIVTYDGVKYTVTQIAERAFKDCRQITKVTLPATLSQIEREAFAGCTSLQEINTPQPLSVIGDYAFDGCSSLRAFSLDASISSLGVGAFRGCSSLEKLEFTPSFTEIPDELCSGCSSLREIVLPATIKSVGASAFARCVSAGSISIDSSLQSIGAYGFADCGSVKSISSRTATPPACPANTFEGVDPRVPVTVPMANVADYQAAAGWSRFLNYIGKY